MRAASRHMIPVMVVLSVLMAAPPAALAITADRAPVNRNLERWTGDYVAAGVDSIEVTMANLGATAFSIRVAFQEAGQDRFVSTDPVEVPADRVWRTHVFGLTAAELTQIGGAATLEEVLAAVPELRILHEACRWQADPIAATLGLDDIRALSDPSPAEAATRGEIKRKNGEE